MDKENIAIIAAGVAAIASLTNVVVNVWFTRKATRETQYRELLKPHVEQLGATLHGVLAMCTTIARRAGKDETTTDWFKKAHEACKELKALYPKVKYPLQGVTNGIRELTRLANWIDHTKKRDDRRSKLLESAEGLRVVLDDAIRNAYLMHPLILHRRFL